MGRKGIYIFGLILILCFTPGQSAKGQEGGSGQPEERLRVASFAGSAPQYFSPLGGLTSEGQTQYAGFYVDLWDAIARDLGLEYEWVEAQTFPELLELVQTGQVDVAAYHLSITADREAVMDFSHTVFEDGYQLYVPNDLGRGLNIWQIARDANLLRIVGVTLVTLLVVAHLAWLVERRKENASFRKNYVEGIEDAFWWTVVTITTVGYGDKTPVSRTGRALAILLMFLSLFLVSLVVGEITTALTVARLESIIEGPADLPGHSVGVLEGTVFDDYVTGLGLQPVRYPSADEMFAALGQSEIDVVVHSKAGGLLLNRSLASDIHSVGSTFRLDDIALGLPSNSPLQEDINLVILRMRETGEYDRIYERWFGS